MHFTGDARSSCEQSCSVTKTLERRPQLRSIQHLLPPGACADARLTTKVKNSSCHSGERRTTARCSYAHVSTHTVLSRRSFSVWWRCCCRFLPDATVVLRQRSTSSRANSARMAERRLLGQAVRAAPQAEPPDLGVRPLDQEAPAPLVEVATAATAAMAALEVPKGEVAVTVAGQIVTLVVDHRSELWLRDR